MGVKVVILCGGEGTRLKEETEFKPKPMVEVGGKPILWHIMSIYSHYGFNEFILCLGYKSQMIKRFFVEHEWDTSDFTLDLKTKEIVVHNPVKEDWKITFVETGPRTQTAGRVKQVEKYIKEAHFMLTYGDGVADVDIARLYENHKKSGKMVTVTGLHPVSKYGLVRVGKDMEVLDFQEKPMMEDLISGGFMVMNKEFFRQIDKDGMFESTVLPKLSKDRQVNLYKHEGFWQCMDTYKDVEHLNKLWGGSRPWKVW